MLSCCIMVEVSIVEVSPASAELGLPEGGGVNPVGTSPIPGAVNVFWCAWFGGGGGGPSH